MKNASIYWPQVRGEVRNSSGVDILVELDDELNIFDFIELKLELENAINKRVDLIEYQMIKPTLKERI
ncbi:MAG: nucleotidyltransferase family protein [Promethearchaeota archaeon]